MVHGERQARIGETIGLLWRWARILDPSISRRTPEPPLTTFPFVHILTSVQEGQIKLIATLGFLTDVGFSVDSAASYDRAAVIYLPESASCLTFGVFQQLLFLLPLLLTPYFIMTSPIAPPTLMFFIAFRV